jgi:histidyl-tRNA synthetase
MIKQKNILTAPKTETNGMRSAKKIPEFKSSEKSAGVAQYYGFTILPPLEIQRDDHYKTKNLLEIDLSKQDGADEHSLAIYPEEKVALLRTYLQQEMHTWSQPVMLYYEGRYERGAEDGYVGHNLHNNKRHAKNAKKKGIEREHTFHLDVLGTTKSIAEATLIKTGIEILREEGFTDLIVHINSVGDRDSMARFCRELAVYYRKNIDLLSPHCRQLLKKDPYEVFECKNEKCLAVKEHAPSPMSYLTEPSREHFREVLEYLETLGITYKIDNTLVCSKKMWSQTAFEIREVPPEIETAQSDSIASIAVNPEVLSPQTQAVASETIPADESLETDENKPDELDINEVRNIDADGISESENDIAIRSSSTIARSSIKTQSGQLQSNIALIAKSQSPTLSIQSSNQTSLPVKAKEERHAPLNGTLLAVGMRYNGIARKIGFRKELGAIGMTVSYTKKMSSDKSNAHKNKKTATKSSTKSTLKSSMKAPRAYFIQLGFDAKLRSLQVIEMLRQAGIPLAQSLGKDKLGGQIQSAETSNIPYTIIMGQKEARDNTVIVRKMSTRSQEIVPIDKLSAYLKKVK